MNAIWLRKEGDHAVVLIEFFIDGHKLWLEIIREHTDGPFSHIIEPMGVEARRDKAIKDASTTRSKK